MDSRPLEEPDKANDSNERSTSVEGSNLQDKNKAVKTNSVIALLKKYKTVLIGLAALLLLIGLLLVFVELRHPNKAVPLSSKTTTQTGINNVEQLKAARDKLVQTVQPISSDVSQLEALK